MNDLHAQCTFDPKRPKSEMMARMQCYRLIGLDLANLNSATILVKYFIKIVPHDYDENLRAVRVTAEVQT